MITQEQLNKAQFSAYENPVAVGGWRGWYDNENGECIAFLDIAGRVWVFEGGFDNALSAKE